MNSPILQLLVLAGIAIFLILRLKSVLGTRDGFEGPARSAPTPETSRRREFEVIEGGPDHDIVDHVPEDSEAAGALADMKRIEPDFSVTTFLQGARGAYEMIVEAFAGGDLKSIRRYLGQSVYDAFKGAVVERETNGWTHELKFVGIDSAKVVSSGVDNAELSAIVDFSSNQVRVTRDKDGNVVDGDPARIDLVKDRWTFSRALSSNDPNWILVATGGAG